MPLLQATPAPSPEELAELDLEEGFVPEDLLQVGDGCRGVMCWYAKVADGVRERMRTCWWVGSWAELDLDEGFVPEDLLQVGGWMGGWLGLLCTWMVGFL